MGSRTTRSCGVIKPKLSIIMSPDFPCPEIVLKTTFCSLFSSCVIIWKMRSNLLFDGLEGKNKLRNSVNSGK